MIFKELPLSAGVTGRLDFVFTDAEPASVALAGAVFGPDNVPLAFERDGDSLIMPAMEEGLWLYEVRANGAPLMRGHLNVSPSPLAGADGARAWIIETSLASTVAKVTVTLAEGPRGPQGDKGDKGDKGAKGDKGLKGDPGPAPSAADVLDAAASVLTSSVSVSTPSPNSNTGARAFILPSSYIPAGTLRSVSVICRSQGSTGIAASPVYLLAQQEETNGTWRNLGYSSNSVQQVPGSVNEWTFPDLPVQPGRRLGFVAKADTSGSASTLGLRVLTNADAEAVCVDAGGSAKENQLAGCTLFLSVPTAFPLSGDDFSALRAIIARKDDLLALLNV